MELLGDRQRAIAADEISPESPNRSTVVARAGQQFEVDFTCFETPLWWRTAPVGRA